MGFGSATLITGLTYITKFTTMKQRFGAVGSYRIAQTIARMIGPSIGFIFVGLPDPVKDKSVILNLFNFFTMPGWLSAVLGFVSIFLVMRWFCDEAVPVPEIASGDDDSNGARESCGAALEKSQEEVRVFSKRICWRVSSEEIVAYLDSSTRLLTQISSRYRTSAAPASKASRIALRNSCSACTREASSGRPCTLSSFASF